MATLLSILKQRVIPQVAEGSSPSLVVASAPLDEDGLPEGVSFSPAELKGIRRPTKGPREYGNSNLTWAHWKPAALIEAGVPKLFYVVNGHADLQAGEICLHCDAGVFVLIPTGVPHPDGKFPHLEGERRNTPGESCDLLWFMPLGRGIHCWLCHSKGAWRAAKPGYGNNRFGHARGEECFIISEPGVQIFGLLADEAISARPHSDETCAGLIRALLNILLREMEAGNMLQSLASSGDQVFGKKRDDPIERAQHYIRNHLHEPLTIEKVSRYCLMSKTNFTQRFRLETGESFMDFLTRCRLDEAKTLLCESDWSIARISAYVGLRSPSYFGEVFARDIGMTPTHFRQTKRQKPPAEAQPNIKRSSRGNASA